MEFQERLREGFRGADIALSGGAAERNVLKDILRGRTGGTLAVLVFAVSKVKHEPLGSHACLGVSGSGVGPVAGLGVAHEDEQFGGFVRRQVALRHVAGGDRARDIELFSIAHE